MPTSSVSPELLDKCKKWLIGESKNWESGVCWGAYVDNLKSGNIIPGHRYCHSWIPTIYHKENHKLILSCHSKTRSKKVCSTKACDFLVRWMAKESPFSQYILNRDDDTSLTEGGVILLMGKEGLSRNEALWICKVLRFTTEGAKAADTFMTLVQGGVDGMLALYVASFIRSCKGATFGYTGLHGHSTVIDKFTDPVKMIKKEIAPNATTTYSIFADKNSKSYTLGSASFVNEKVKGFCEPFQKSDGWGGTTKGNGVDKDELIRRVLEWQKELTEDSAPTKETVYLEVDL